jgi:rod shape determining protein RodA
VGLTAGIGVCLMDYRFVQRMAWPIYGANAAALMALKFIGHRAKGEASWIALGPLRVEPAEFMKLALIIALARFFHDDYREGEQPYGPVRLWKPLLLTLFAAGLVLPDLGNTMMILLTACTILVFSRLRLWVLGSGRGGAARGLADHLERLRARPVRRAPHGDPPGAEAAPEPAHRRVAARRSRT